MDIKASKRTIKCRPIPQSGINAFGSEITKHDWSEVLSKSSVNDKVSSFHEPISLLLNKYFPEKTTVVPNLDQQWMNPEVKMAHQRMQREFVKNWKSV